MKASLRLPKKNECELKVRDSDLIDEIAQKEIILFSDTSNSQTVSMAKSEISDFEVYKKTSENRGKARRF